MSKTNLKLNSDQTVFVGIDLHRKSWHVTIRSQDVELFCGRIPATWDALRLMLDRYKAQPIQAVYEAANFGYWLHDCLVEFGADCIVTPPSLIPQQIGNRVKTDRRDSRKLAYFLAKGMLKVVWGPSLQEREQRQVVRRRRQLISDRVRTQNRIKAELRFYAIELPEPQGLGGKSTLRTCAGCGSRPVGCKRASRGFYSSMSRSATSLSSGRSC